MENKNRVLFTTPAAATFNLIKMYGSSAPDLTILTAINTIVICDTGFIKDFYKNYLVLLKSTTKY